MYMCTFFPPCYVECTFFIVRNVQCTHIPDDMIIRFLRDITTYLLPDQDKKLSGCM